VKGIGEFLSHVCTSQVLELLPLLQVLLVSHHLFLCSPLNSLYNISQPFLASDRRIGSI